MLSRLVLVLVIALSSFTVAAQEGQQGSSVYEGRLKLHEDDPSWKLVFIEIPTDPEGRLRVVGRNTGRVYYEHGVSSEDNEDNSGFRRGDLPKPGLSGWQKFGIASAIGGLVAFGIGAREDIEEIYEESSSDIEDHFPDVMMVGGGALMVVGAVSLSVNDYYPVLILPGPMYLSAPEHVLQRAARSSGTTVSLQNPLRPLPALPKYTLGISPMRRGTFALATIRF